MYIWSNNNNRIVNILFTINWRSDWTRPIKILYDKSHEIDIIKKKELYTIYTQDTNIREKIYKFMYVFWIIYSTTYTIFLILLEIERWRAHVCNVRLRRTLAESDIYFYFFLIEIYVFLKLEIFPSSNGIHRAHLPCRVVIRQLNYYLFSIPLSLLLLHSEHRPRLQ